MEYSGTPGVTKMKLSDEKGITGKFAIVWRNETKTPAKVVGFMDDTDGRRVIYELIAGQDKGETFTCRFSPNQEVDTFDEGSVILAALDV